MSVQVKIAWTAVLALMPLEGLLLILYWEISITKPCGSGRAGVPTL